MGRVSESGCARLLIHLEVLRPPRKAQAQSIASKVKAIAASRFCRLQGLDLIEFGRTNSGFGQNNTRHIIWIIQELNDLSRWNQLVTYDAC
jgi:hypothetical protein